MVCKKRYVTVFGLKFYGPHESKIQCIRRNPKKFGSYFVWFECAKCGVELNQKEMSSHDLSHMGLDARKLAVISTKNATYEIQELK